MTLKPFQLLQNVGGKNDRVGGLSKPIQMAERVENLHYVDSYALTAENQGYSVLHSVGGSPAKGVYPYEVSGQKRVLAVLSTQLVAYNEATGVLTTNVNSGAPFSGANPQATLFQDKLIFCGTGQEVKYWNHTGGLQNFASGFPITLHATTYSKPKLVCTYNNRAVYANFDTQKSTVVFSRTLLPDDFTVSASDETSAIFQDVEPGDGEEIVAIRPLFVPGQSKAYLAVFKRTKTYLIDGDSPSTLRMDRLSDTYGCISPNGVVQVGNDLYFMSAVGIMSLGASVATGFIEPSLAAARNVQKTYDSINPLYESRAWAQHQPDRREVWFAFPEGSSQVCNRVLVLKYKTGEDELDRWTEKVDYPLQATCRLGKNYYGASSSGELCKLFTQSLYGSATPMWRYTYYPTDFGAVHLTKRLKDLYTWFDGTGLVNATLATRWEFNRGSRTYEFPVISVGPQAAAVYDSSIYDASVYGGTPSQVTKIKVPARGNGQRVEFSIYGSAALSTPKFLGLTGLVEIGSIARSSL